MKKRVLFICTHNSARSQMAEALLNHMKGEAYTAFSAGTHPTRVHPGAISALKEMGIDTSALRSKSAAEFLGERFDLVVTICDKAKETCPFFPGASKTVHSAFPDPEDLILGGRSGEEVFQEVRDMIRYWIDCNF